MRFCHQSELEGLCFDINIMPNHWYNFGSILALHGIAPYLITGSTPALINLSALLHFVDLHRGTESSC